MHLNIDFQKFLETYYSQDENIIIWCSTWADSMFLLYNTLQTSFRKNIVACYFNHKTRPETDSEEKFLEELWKKEWFIVESASCDFEKIKKLYPQKWFEELAREKRYQFFDAIMNIYSSNKVILGHHLDDKIETFFFNLARWSKLTGLINMTEHSGWILRPLLQTKKTIIYDYLHRHNLVYNEDITNTDTTITRNYLRNDVVPLFEKVNSNFKNHLSHTMDYFEELKDEINTQVENFLEDQKLQINNDEKYTDFLENYLYNKTSWCIWENYFTNNLYISFFYIEDFNKKTNLMKKEIIHYLYTKCNNNSSIWMSSSNIAEIIRFINWKNNKTSKILKKMHLLKENRIIIYKAVD